MVQVCIVCDKIYGEKEPLTLRETTHGLCMECLKARLKLLTEKPRKRCIGCWAENGCTAEMSLKCLG